MATTKELLEKAMLRLGSRGARSSASAAVDLSPDQSATGNQQFVASEDGHITAWGNPTTWEWAYIQLGTRSCGVYQPTMGADGMCMVSAFVSKGETFRVEYSNIRNRTLTFIKSVGGGA